MTHSHYYWTLLLLFTLSTTATTQSIWTASQADTSHLRAIEHEYLPKKFRLLQLDGSTLQNNLNSQDAGEQCIDIPMPDGSEECFFIQKSNIIPESLKANRPDIQSYKGYSLHSPKARVYFVQTNDDFHLIGDSDEGTFFIDQFKEGANKHYLSFFAKDEIIPAFSCNSVEQEENLRPNDDNVQNRILATSWGTELRKFRAAIMWTPGHVATYDNDTTAIINRNVEIINDMNFVLERDLCVTFELAEHPERLIFPDEATNPYDGLGSATGIINGLIGAENYEIGHVINGGGGGVSYLGVTCGGAKAGTQSSNSHWVIVHEWGHNMGAGHTFNHCPGWGGPGIEPGAGNSIMSYGGTGVCSSGHQVPGGRINYFHSRSVEQMYNKLFLNSSCAESIVTGNTPPTITMPAGGMTIPKSTPFTLTGSATDAEDDSNLTYSWEQYQSGIGSNPNAPTADDPLFRMFPFSTSPSRTVPQIENIINGYNYGEVLSEVSRTLNFRLSVRDNHLNGSGIAFDNMEFFVEESAGPFVVNFPNESTTLGSVGQTRTITWDVANTDIAPVNCAMVDILLSTDGGYTYPITLASNEANDGSADITIPDAIGTQNRIKIQAADNIFFDISDNDFEIVAADVNDFVLTIDAVRHTVCDETSISYQLDLYALGVFSNTIDLMWTGLPTGASLAMPSTVDGTSLTTITISGLDGVTAGFYPMTLALNESGGGVSKSINLELTIKENNMSFTPDQAMSFDGSSWVHIPKTGNDLNFGDDRDFSIEFWTKTTSTSGDDALMSDKNWDSGNNKGWVVFMQSGELGFNAGENGANNRVDIRTNGVTFNDGEWHHVAVSFSRAGNGLVQLYVDGVFYSQAGMGHLGSIDSEHDLVIGADKDNDYAYEGEIDEVRIWSKALTAEEIRASMHLVLENCDSDLISCYQFNEASGDVLDAFSHHDGTITNATRVVSSAPFGTGTSDTQSETMGIVNFNNTDFTANYQTENGATVTATKINLAPFGTTGLETGDVVLDQQYWVLRSPENSETVYFNGTFQIAEDISTADSETPFIYKLYHRAFNADGDWTLLNFASLADDANNSLTFDNIPTYGQYLITKSTQATIAVYINELAFCNVALGNESEVLTYEVAGLFLTEDITITAPTGFEISMTTNDNFGTSLSLPAADGRVHATTIYVRFVPNQEGDISGTLSHISVGANQRSIQLTGKSIIPLAYQAMNFDETAHIHIPKTNSDFDFGTDRDFSIDFWTKTSTNSGDDAIISDKNWDSGSNNGWVIAIQSGAFVFNAGSNGNRIDIGTGSAIDYNDNEWHHVAVSFSRAGAGWVQIYADGILKGERDLTNLGDINTTLGIAIGADPNNNWAYEGQVEEVRIWNKALSVTEIRERMHLIYTGCTPNLIANYHLDETDGTALDALGLHHGEATASIVSIESSAPIGSGTSNTQMEMNGWVDFPTTDCSIDYNQQNEATAVVSKINNAPYNTTSITGQDEVFDTQYWVLNRYGTGDFEGNVTFYPTETISSFDAQNPSQFSLFGRMSNADADWIFISSATNADDITNALTFENVAQAGQYVITKSALVLPLELLSFNGERQEDVVFLNWETANEQAIYGFEIQRKTADKDFEKIAWVAAQNKTAASYRFEDKTASFEQENYYRLKIIDESGAFKYSNIIVIKAEQVALPIELYPNPAQDKFRIDTHFESDIVVVLYDVYGKKVVARTFYQQGEMDIADLAVGVYFCEIRSGGIREIFKVVVE